jgi:hypothetical protein
VRNDGAHTSAVEHKWNEPLVDVGREVTDDVTARRVHPNAWFVGAGRIWDQDQLVARAEPMQHFGALSEDRPIYRGIKLTRAGKDRGHTKAM